MTTQLRTDFVKMIEKICEKRGLAYGCVVKDLLIDGFNPEDKLWTSYDLQNTSWENDYYYPDFDFGDAKSKKVTVKMFRDQTGIEYKAPKKTKKEKEFDPDVVTEKAYELLCENNLTVDDIKDPSGSKGNIVVNDVKRHLKKMKGETTSEKKSSGPRISNAAKALAVQHGIDITTVKGSGAKGYIKKTDIEELIEQEDTTSQATVENAEPVDLDVEGVSKEVYDEVQNVTMDDEAIRIARKYKLDQQGEGHMEKLLALMKEKDLDNVTGDLVEEYIDLYNISPPLVFKRSAKKMFDEHNLTDEDQDNLVKLVEARNEHKITCEIVQEYIDSKSAFGCEQDSESDDESLIGEIEANLADGSFELVE